MAWDPDGDGDDDSNPAGDTDHSHWDPNGNQLKSVPGKPLDASLNPIDIHNAAVDNSPWDAGRAWSNGATSDNPATFYNGICAGKKSGDPATQAGHALPHHYHPGDAPNAAAVRAGLAALGGARNGVKDLTNRDAAQSHLESHMKTINPDWEPSGSSNNLYGLTDAEINKFAASLRL